MRNYQRENTAIHRNRVRLTMKYRGHVWCGECKRGACSSVDGRNGSLTVARVGQCGSG